MGGRIQAPRTRDSHDNEQSPDPGRSVAAAEHQRDGECHPRARHGCRSAGQVRPSRHADGHGRRRDRAVHAIPEVRRRRARLARPRPLRAVGRPRLDAALRAALSHRLSRHDDRGAEAFPPARLQDRRPSRIRPRAGHRDDHRSARPGPRQRRRHGDGRAAAATRGSATTSSITTPMSSPATAA